LLLNEKIMGRTTTDRNDPEINVPDEITGQNKAYLILSDEERSQGFVRPVRETYVHLKCATTTRMSRDIAETYARDPKFYGATWCISCRAHLPVSEFVWSGTKETVGS
jgi:hypothetical protein